MEGRTRSYLNEFRMLTKSGGWCWILSRGMVMVRDAEGKPVRMLGTHTDVTESHTAEAALRESEERLRTFIDNAPVAIGVARGGMTVYGNEAYFRLFGVTNRQEVIDHPLAESVAPRDREEVVARAERRSRGEPAEDEYEMMGMRLDGLQFPCRVAVSKLALSDGPATMAFFFDLTTQKESEKKLEDSRGKMRSLAIHLLHAREEERKRVAREIHDELGQILTALKMDLQWIEKRLAPRTPRIMEKIQGVVGLADQTIQMVHRISSELRPGMLDDLGLAAAVEWLGGDFSRRNGIPCRVDITARESRIGGNSSTALFRIIQEALTNVARHAHASHASVELWEEDGALKIRVKDDGEGVTEEQSTSPQSFGLIGIRERAQALGGEMSITGRPGKGTTLTVTIPLPSEGQLS
jgi:PAS domain S-box-containing protein